MVPLKSSLTHIYLRMEIDGPFVVKGTVLACPSHEWYFRMRYRTFHFLGGRQKRKRKGEEKGCSVCFRACLLLCSKACVLDLEQYSKAFSLPPSTNPWTLNTWPFFSVSWLMRIQSLNKKMFRISDICILFYMCGHHTNKEFSVVIVIIIIIIII